jgi:D-beta-D-heptose 7-phosphate kinase/D-beta-D-heptose 1-phosphate adenosyltransferase
MVFGDLMLDRYRRGIARRISQEAPVLILEVKEKKYVLGGAGNTAVNLHSLGAVPQLVGIVGLDYESQRVEEEMKKLGLEDSGVLFSQNTPGTILKERNVAEGHQLLRVDENDKIEPHPNHDRHILDRFYEGIKDASIVVISDYAKGTLSESVIAEIITKSRELGKRTIIDPKPKHVRAYHGASFIKMNYSEGLGIASLLGDNTFREVELSKANSEEVGRALSRRLANYFDSDIILTMSQYGIHYCPSKGDSEQFYTFERQVSDVSGAGDTVAATLAVSLANRLSPREAIYLANHAGGVKVQKSGVQPVTWNEIFADIKSRESIQ